MKRIMMIAAVAAMAGLLFVACKNTPKAAEEAAPKEPDVTALNAGDDLDWEEFSRYYSSIEEETPECCKEACEEAEEFAEEVAEEVEEAAEEVAEHAEEAIMEPGTIEPDEDSPCTEEEIGEEEANAAPLEYFAVAQKPGFEGGDANAFSKWVAKNMEYPEAARAADIEGTVVVKFTIGKNGAVRGAHVVKSSGNAALDAEAVRTISSAPAWTPGFDSEGVPVSTNMVMPVIFKLQH